jgi:hypothetical protein
VELRQATAATSAAHRWINCNCILVCHAAQHTVQLQRGQQLHPPTCTMRGILLTLPSSRVFRLGEADSLALGGPPGGDCSLGDRRRVRRWRRMSPAPESRGRGSSCFMHAQPT